MTENRLKFRVYDIRRKVYFNDPVPPLNSDGTLECTECPVGSYCPGGKFTVESENNGVNTCPTDYTSDAGATGENECYMGCELACSKNVECPIAPPFDPPLPSAPADIRRRSSR